MSQRPFLLQFPLGLPDLGFFHQVKSDRYLVSTGDKWFLARLIFHSHLVLVWSGIAHLQPLERHRLGFFSLQSNNEYPYTLHP